MAQPAWERFRVVRELGSGSFGRTILVKDQSHGGKQVVIKVPLNEETETALIQELINSAVLRNSLSEMYHPNIVKYIGFARYEGRFVMIMEYVKGKDLRKIIGPVNQNREPMDVAGGCPTDS